MYVKKERRRNSYHEVSEFRFGQRISFRIACVHVLLLQITKTYSVCDIIAELVQCSHTIAVLSPVWVEFAEQAFDFDRGAISVLFVGHGQRTAGAKKWLPLRFFLGFALEIKIWKVI